MPKPLLAMAEDPGKPDVSKIPWYKQLLFSAIAIGIFMFVLLVMAEIGLRLVAYDDFRGVSFTVEDPELTWVNKKSVDTEARGPDYSYQVKTNSLGLRGSELQPAPAGRILLLGDSYTFGSGVNDDETFAAQLQQQIEATDAKGWHVVNAGVTGYGARQSYKYAQRVWDEVQPKAVVYTHCGNDFGDDLRFASGTYRSVRNWLPGRRFLKENSVVYNLVKPIFLAALSRLGVYNPDIEFEAENEGALVSNLKNETWARGRDLTCETLGELRDEAKKRGAAFMVSTVGFWAADNKINFSTDAQALIDCLKAKDIPFVDPSAVFPTVEEKPWTNAHSAGHYSVFGNSLFARSLHAGLVQQGVISDPTAAPLAVPAAVPSAEE